jgi:aspartyl-tRNA(Asn)/glutamyl-tRNA(Gln) amidotransferase subunit A
MGVADLGSAYRAGSLSPVDAVEACLDRIERLDGTLNAMVHVAWDGARTEAEASARRHRRGEALSPLDGVPLTVKDNLLVRGMPATWGSRVLGDYTPGKDELPVARLREAGAVILGKTNVPEFTLEGYTSNLRFGTTRNPWDLALTPGGSSGGAAASVAAGFAPAALATDGGGSIRRPASHTGLVGYKPSTGRVPRLDGFPSILLDCEVVGPLARSVADIRLLDVVLSRRDIRDWRARVECCPPRRGSLRIAWIQRFEDSPLDPDIAASISGAAEVLRDLGHAVVPVDSLPFALADIAATWGSLVQVGLAYLREHFGPERFDQGGAPHWQQGAADGADIRATAYLRAIEQLATLRRTVAEFFADYDVVLTPAAAALPWPAEDPFPAVIDGRPVGPRGHAVYTAWVNMCGSPAVALPATPSHTGLPIGFQLVGGFGDDETLLDLAGQYEMACPWHSRRPVQLA